MANLKDNMAQSKDNMVKSEIKMANNLYQILIFFKGEMPYFIIDVFKKNDYRNQK
jgi:hypothetical protein